MKSLLLFVIVFTHALGIILYLINYIYLFWNRTRKMNNVCCCRINGDLSRTMFLLYCVILQIMDLLFMTIVQVDQNLNYQLTDEKDLATSLALAAGFNFALVIYLGPFKLTGDSYKRGNIGPLNGNNLFVIFNFIMFWFTVFASLSCSATECHGMTVFDVLKEDYWIIPLAIAYKAMVLEASASATYLMKQVHSNALTKEEAVKTMEETLRKRPAVLWRVKCDDHPCEEIVQTLEGDNWAAIAPHGQALQQFFEKPLTYLTIKTVININNKSVHQELVNQLETLKQQHAGHKYPLHISTKQYTEDMFLVATGHTYMSPTFRRTLYWICTYLGLSLVYRLVMYLNTGHEEYKIKKEFQSEENFQPFQINLTAPTRKEIEVKFNGELEEDIIAVDVGQLSDNGDDVGQLPDNGNYVGQLSDNGNDVGQLSDIGNEDCHKEDCQEEVHNQTNSRYEDSEQAGLEKADNEDCGKENSIKLDLEKEIYYNDSKDSFV